MRGGRPLAYLAALLLSSGTQAGLGQALAEPAAREQELEQRALQYAAGDGVPQDPEQAAGLFRRACDGGSARACNNLGVMYHNGVGVPRDDALAATLFEQSCHAGNAAGCFNLGQLHERTPEGVVRAVTLYRRACTAGHEPACARVPAEQPTARRAVQLPEPLHPTSPDTASPCERNREDQACWTPRTGVVAAFSLAFEGGYITVQPDAARRTSLGDGGTFAVRAGLALWDQLVLGLSMGGMFFKDYAPTSVLVVDCTYFQNVEIECDDEPHAQSSDVSGFFMSIEAGYQWRFRPWRPFSIAPAFTLGGLIVPNLKRQVACMDCPGGDKLNLDAAGGYVVGALRMTFGQSGYFALNVRSLWFFKSDLRQIASLAFEVGLP